MYDIFMLTYKEPNGDENFARLKKLQPKAQRIDNIKGILNAHKMCAENSKGSHFYVVDGDNYVYDSFHFDYEIKEEDQEAIHVWRCKNAVNDLVYGYGAIKLFPKVHVQAKANMNLDMSTSLAPKYRIVHTLASETQFNTDPYNTWKSAFRECVKLSSGLIKNSQQKESQERLDTWCELGADRPFGKWCILGANMGREFVDVNKEQPEQLNKINDFDWLEEKFKEVELSQT